MDPELLHDRRLVEDLLLPAVVGDDAIAHHDLGHVLVRAADDDLLHVVDPTDRGRSDGVVRLVLDVAPDHDPDRLQGVLGVRELPQQLRVHAGGGLVVREHLVPEGLDHGVEAGREMGDARLSQESEGRLEDAQRGVDVVPVRGEHRVPTPVVGAEQLVGTIQEVETHDTDPTADESPDPWDSLRTELRALGETIKDTYRRVSADGGPSEEEIRQAFSTLLGAWDQVAESVGSALRDPEIQQRLRTAASSLATAVGNTISELGTELGSREQADGTDAA